MPPTTETFSSFAHLRAVRRAGRTECRRIYANKHGTTQHGARAQRENGQVHAKQVRLAQTVLNEVLLDRTHLLPLFQTLQHAHVDVAAHAHGAVGCRGNQEGSRSHEAVPHEHAIPGEDLVGHEGGQLGTGGRGTNVVALLQVEAGIGVALAIGDESAQEQIQNRVGSVLVVENTAKDVPWLAHANGTLEGHIGFKLQTEHFLLLGRQRLVVAHDIEAPALIRLSRIPFLHAYCVVGVCKGFWELLESIEQLLPGRTLTPQFVHRFDEHCSGTYLCNE